MGCEQCITLAKTKMFSINHRFVNDCGTENITYFPPIHLIRGIHLQDFNLVF